MVHTAEYIGNKPDEAFAAVDPIPQAVPWEAAQQGIDDYLERHNREKEAFDKLVEERTQNPALRPAAKKAK